MDDRARVFFYKDVNAYPAFRTTGRSAIDSRRVRPRDFDKKGVFLMKRFAVLLICAVMLCLLTHALADGNPFAWPDDQAGASAQDVRESIRLEIGGKSLPLMFDSSDEYSSITGNSVQASFYAYSDDADYLYELYMVFPEDVQPGSVVTPDFAIQNDPNCSVVLIVSSSESEVYYFAGQVDGSIFPSESSYSIAFDSVTGSADSCMYSGTLSASLIEMDSDGASKPGRFTIDSAPFSFTMPLHGAAPAVPDATPRPDEGFEAKPFVPVETPRAYKI